MAESNSAAVFGSSIVFSRIDGFMPFIDIVVGAQPVVGRYGSRGKAFQVVFEVFGRVSVGFVPCAPLNGAGFHVGVCVGGIAGQ
ncbi:hypothetical protein GA0061078_0894 [Bifidobacterium bohemicum]|uniref:Uncharacterized protein n=1 Tax=Bifidobacterium bohemicum DSM 22767 TaxID=1437606 RepID=A0A086ZEU6_9BIFI|nr:hypothetical protein [Bifidobacterium bohemicum]KFI45046.1 hypothetical protein BBOH_1307 [Bifidobacterium bohemicum DSM 22767]SCB92874.1 hypothetical protein GA0061078_0894 [Bifidobacterium bohemicum]